MWGVSVELERIVISGFYRHTSHTHEKRKEESDPIIVRVKTGSGGC
jgi:hypothetical protein